MITTVSCKLLLQATCLLVNYHSWFIAASNLFTRKLVNSSTTTQDLLLQATCKLVNLSTRQLQIMITDVNYK